MHPDQPPEPPTVTTAGATAIINWLQATAAWLAEEQQEARRHGHTDSADMLRNQRLYEDAALLFQEAYGVERG